MATTGTVTFTSPSIYGNQDIGTSGDNIPVFQMTRSDGSFPSGTYKITKVKLNIQYSNYTDGGTIRLQKGTSVSNARGSSSTLLASGIRVGAPRTLTLSDNDATNISRWSDLGGKYMAVRGVSTPISTLKSGTTISVVVTWQLTEQQATITGKSASAVDLGQTITFTIDPGIGCDTFSMSASVGGNTKQIYATGTNTYSFKVPDGSNLLDGNWASYISGTSATATATLSFKMGGTTYAATTNFTVNVPSSVRPTDVTIATPVITKNNGGITGDPTLQGMSTVTLTGSATPPAAPDQTLIYIWTLSDGQTGYGSTWTSQPFRASGDITATLKVIDIRLRNATDTVTISNVTAYSPPNVTGDSSILRGDYQGGTWTDSPAEGTFVKIFPVYTYTSITGNTVTTKFDWKNKSSAAYTSTYTPTTPIASGLYQIVGTNITGGESIPVNQEYLARITVTDSVGNSSSIELDIDTAEALMVWDGSQSAIGFGCHPAAANTVEIAETWDVVRYNTNTSSYDSAFGGAVTGVKGNAEDDYRTGQVNLTAANIGAATSGHSHSNATTSAAGFMSTTDKSKLDAVGTYYSNSGSPSAANNSNTTLCSIANVPVGVYVVEATCRFANNSTGRRGLRIDTSASSAESATQHTMVVPAASGYTIVNTAAVLSITATSTIYARVYQNSGSALSTSGYMYAVRIK